MYLVQVLEDTARPVQFHGIVVPGLLPQLVHHRHEFLGQLVSIVVGERTRAEVARCTGV
jgi:hypothetical protein